MSPVVSEADLIAMRGLQADNFPHLCRLETITGYTETPTGGVVPTWAIYAQNIRCRLVPLSGSELPRGAVLTPETNFRLALPYGQPVAEKDRAVVTGLTNGIGWTVTIGFTFIDTPKAFQTATYTYGTDKVEQV